MIHRLKIKLANHKLADSDGFVHFDVAPGHNPFETAKLMASSLEQDPDGVYCLMAVDGSGKLWLNFNELNNGDEVSLVVIDEPYFASVSDDEEIV